MLITFQLTQNLDCISVTLFISLPLNWTKIFISGTLFIPLPLNKNLYFRHPVHYFAADPKSFYFRHPVPILSHLRVQVLPAVLLLRLPGGLGVRVDARGGAGPPRLRCAAGAGCGEGSHAHQLPLLHPSCSRYTAVPTYILKGTVSGIFDPNFFYSKHPGPIWTGENSFANCFVIHKMFDCQVRNSKFTVYALFKITLTLCPHNRYADMQNSRISSRKRKYSRNSFSLFI